MIGVRERPEDYLDRLNAENQSLRTRIAELEQALRLHLAVGPDDPVLIEPIEKRLAAVEQERDEWKSDDLATEQQLDDTHERLVTAQATITRREQDLELQRTRNVSMGVSLDARDARIKELEAESQGWQDQLANLQDSVEQQLATKNNVIALLKDRITQLHDQLATAQEDF